ncbi:MAG: hypothetical protein MUP28_06900 [Candidatus Aminicenantes bacterium]|nr:hypothetical protein [Candidatus Aminicenantes bacterium]
MSRPKSAATIQRERDRAARKKERERKQAEKERDQKIREERRERKQAEQKVKREARRKKKLTRESVERNGVPKVQSAGEELGFRDAVACSPLMDCKRCHAIVHELYGTLCERCHYGKEVNDQDEKELKARGNKAVPGNGDGGCGTKALAGQLSLLI